MKERMTWPCDVHTFARKVRDPSYGVHGRKEQRTKNLECPACGYDFSQTIEWPGLPAGVKFEPTDLEILGHVAAKVDPCASKAHPFIDDFIVTLGGEDGICYTHPEKIPGVRSDGSSAHFFHLPMKAYTTGSRKRRKVQTGGESGSGAELRWHKTGKTRGFKKDGENIGWKKIMVLYVTPGKKAKTEKTNWVMHQYHLGAEEEEREGEFVVSKIFYQVLQKQPAPGRKEDDDDYDHAATELADQQALPYHNSSPGSLSYSSNTLTVAPRPPQTPGPFQGHGVKQHKGLLASITEDVERLQASLSAHSQNTGQSSDQSYLAVAHDSMYSCKTSKDIKGLGNYSLQCSPEIAEKDTCSSGLKNGIEKEKIADLPSQDAFNIAKKPVVFSVPDGLSKSKTRVSETLNPEVLKFLSSENLDVTLSLQKKLDAANVKASNEGGHECETKDAEKLVHKTDFSLENIVLDTPPDFLIESFFNSQESTDWLFKKKFWSDSSQKTEDGSYLDFLRDSQSSL